MCLDLPGSVGNSPGQKFPRLKLTAGDSEPALSVLCLCLAHVPSDKLLAQNGPTPLPFEGQSF